MTDHIRSEKVNGTRLDLYYTTDAVGSRMASCHKRPYVLEVTGQRTRRFSRYDPAVQAYEAARRGCF